MTWKFKCRHCRFKGKAPYLGLAKRQGCGHSDRTGHDVDMWVVL